MNFFLIPFFILLSQVMQTINNILWISKSGEYENYLLIGFFRYNGIILKHEKKEYKTKISYIWNYRIKTVWSNWRDWTSAAIAGIVATVAYMVL